MTTPQPNPTTTTERHCQACGEHLRLKPGRTTIGPNRKYCDNRCAVQAWNANNDPAPLRGYIGDHTL